MICIGSYNLDGQAVLAPMAGVTDLPFRQLCRKMGASLAVSEMLTADKRLWSSRKSQWRMDHRGEEEPRSVQIAGADPQMMAEAARINQDHGAQIIDINMGCPAKKVLKKAAGSALLSNEVLVADIITAVVEAVPLPVTLKIRTGPDKEHRNGVAIARLAEDCGIQALAVHGRTRTCAYQGEAEYDTIAAIKSAVSIPVFANGDITSPEKAKEVLDYTNADAVMIGRAAQGKPWIFREINHYLQTGKHFRSPTLDEQREIILKHMQVLHGFYGEFMGVRFARKHVGWYLQTYDSTCNFRRFFNKLESAKEQLWAISVYFERLRSGEEMAA